MLLLNIKGDAAVVVTANFGWYVPLLDDIVAEFDKSMVNALVVGFSVNGEAVVLITDNDCWYDVRSIVKELVVEFNVNGEAVVLITECFC